MENKNKGLLYLDYCHLRIVKPARLLLSQQILIKSLQQARFWLGTCSTMGNKTEKVADFIHLTFSLEFFHEE